MNLSVDQTDLRFTIPIWYKIHNRYSSKIFEEVSRLTIKGNTWYIRGISSELRYTRFQ